MNIEEFNEQLAIAMDELIAQQAKSSTMFCEELDRLKALTTALPKELVEMCLIAQMKRAEKASQT